MITFKCVECISSGISNIYKTHLRIINNKNANILQLVEDTTDNRVVASSSLAIRTKISGCRKVWLNRVPWEHELAGSNPATQTIIISILLQK